MCVVFCCNVSRRHARGSGRIQWKPTVSTLRRVTWPLDGLYERNYTLPAVNQKNTCEFRITRCLWISKSSHQQLNGVLYFTRCPTVCWTRRRTGFLTASFNARVGVQLRLSQRFASMGCMFARQHDLVLKGLHKYRILHFIYIFYTSVLHRITFFVAMRCWQSYAVVFSIRKGIFISSG